MQGHTKGNKLSLATSACLTQKPPGCMLNRAAKEGRGRGQTYMAVLQWNSLIETREMTDQSFLGLSVEEFALRLGI